MGYQEETLIEELKERWLSNFQAQQLLKSSSADRTIRRIRENPPEGWAIIQRRKDLTDKYNRCLEYKLVRYLGKPKDLRNPIFGTTFDILYGGEK